MEGAGAGVHGNAVPGAAVGRELALESLHFRPERELPALEDARHRLVDFPPDRRILAPEVHQGDVGHDAGEAGRQSCSLNARAAKHQMTSRFRLQ